MIEMKGFTYFYPEADTPSLKDISLEIPQGQFCAVIGRNGAGKSSLCYTLAGIIPHHFRGRIEGMARVAGRDIVHTPPGELVGTVGLVFQNPFNQISGARFSVREEIAFGLENLGVPREEMIARVDAMLEEIGLADLRDRSPYALSGGQQQRLAIASVLVMQPRLLLLDEPTSQLDPHGTREFFQVLEALVSTHKTTVVLASHKLEWIASFADRVIVLAGGSIRADGIPHDVLAATALPELGIEGTQYTQAAVLAQQRGLRPGEGPLPVTLEEAVEFFQ